MTDLIERAVFQRCAQGFIFQVTEREVPLRVSPETYAFSTVGEAAEWLVGQFVEEAETERLQRKWLSDKLSIYAQKHDDVDDVDDGAGDGR